MHPLRPKLADAIADELRRGIRAGRWTTWLPQERLLAGELRISRSTLRQALTKLKHEGYLQPERGHGHRLTGGGRRAAQAAAPLRVNLLMPDDLATVRSPAARWIDELRAQLAREGGLLQILESSACNKPRPAGVLRRLVDQHPATCWILRMSGRATQEWFAAADVPCLVIGTCHDGVPLPFVDVDHRAVSRHAVGRMVARGHRRLALLTPASPHAGDLETERGFVAGVEAARSGIVPTVIRHEEGPTSVARAVERMLRLPSPPTALLLSHASNFLATFCTLARAGRRVPEEFSLVCCTEDAFMDQMLPAPARYHLKPQEFATRSLRWIRQFASGLAIETRHQWILPQFVPGATLAAPAADAANPSRA